MQTIQDGHTLSAKELIFESGYRYPPPVSGCSGGLCLHSAVGCGDSRLEERGWQIAATGVSRCHRLLGQQAS